MTVNGKIVAMRKGSLRDEYPFLPKAAWAELNRLKRDELFSDMPFDTGPGGLVLGRFLSNPSESTTELDLIVVDDAGKVLRFTETLPALPAPVSRSAA